MGVVLMLHSSSDLYGASKIFLQSATVLKEEGHKVIVVFSESGPLVHSLEEKGIEVIIHKLGILRRKYFNPKGLLNRIQTTRSANKFLQQLIKERKVTHVYSNTSAVLVGAFIKRKSNQINHIWHLHEIITGPGWFHRILGFFIRKYSDRVLVVSQAVFDNWQPLLGASKMLLLHNGIDYLPYTQDETKAMDAKPDNKVLIGMIGRVNAWKGQGYFLEMAKEVLDQRDDVHFWIVGDAFPGTEHFINELLTKIEELDLKNHVDYLGFRSDISEILQSLDVFVLPSILPDPFPTVILEAMASAKPVVATAHGGACEMILSEETGFLIPWNDPKTGAEELIRMIDNQKLRETMGRKGRARVLKEFSTMAFQAKFAKLFA